VADDGDVFALRLWANAATANWGGSWDFTFKHGYYMVNINGYVIPYAPWCWNIYLHDWAILGVNVGKYSIHGAYGYG
jgi:hypothetical protein